MEAPLDGAKGDALGAGDLRVGAASGVGKGKGGALGGGQVAEGGAQAADVGVLAGEGVRVGAVGGRDEGHDIDLAVSVTATIIVNGAVAHDGQQPGADAAAGAQGRIRVGGDVHNVLVTMSALVVSRGQDSHEDASPVWPLWGRRYAP